MASDCPFCRKLAALDALPAHDVVWNFPNSVALLGAWQFYEGYCVLVSRTHAVELSHLGDRERQEFLNEMCLLARAIELAFYPHKLNYELLGNQVPHLHWHLFPRSASDPDRLQPVWLALDVAERNATIKERMIGTAARAEVAAKVRSALTSLGAPQP